MAKMLVVFLIAIALNPSGAAAQLHLKPVQDSGATHISLQVLPQNFYSQHIGYFCKKEVQVQKLTALPLYFRLGSKDYVDGLEHGLRSTHP